MKPAVIFSIPTSTSHGYSWRWRSVDSTADSKKQFNYYHECLADARASGYSVQLSVAWQHRSRLGSGDSGNKPLSMKVDLDC
jgi:hypothetical protein